MENVGFITRKTTGERKKPRASRSWFKRLFIRITFQYELEMELASKLAV